MQAKVVVLTERGTDEQYVDLGEGRVEERDIEQLAKLGGGYIPGRRVA